MPVLESTPPLPDEPPFETRDAVLRWLEQHGIGHVAYLGWEAVAPLLDPALRPQLRAAGARRYLTDLAARQTCERVLPLLPAGLREVLPPVVCRFMVMQRDRAQRARREAVERLEAVVGEAAQPTRRRLLALREQFPDSVAPRPDEDLDVKRLRFDEATLRFTFKDVWPSRVRSASLRFAAPQVKLTMQGDAIVAACTCGAESCEHALAAVDTALGWLQQPLSSAQARALERLEQPGWAHTLAALDRAVEATTLERTGFELYWRIAVIEEGHAEVVPWLHKRDPRGRLGAGRPCTASRLRLELGAKLEPADARVISLLPEGGGPASAALLEALIGHPRVVQHGAPDRAVHIARAPLGLLAEERGGALCIAAALDGTPVPASVAARIEQGDPDDVLFIDEGHRLTLLDVSAELRSVLQVLRRQGNLFPPESRAALLASLSRWSARLPIAMPQSVIGAAVPPQTRGILRLEAHTNGAIHLEVRVRPLPEGPSFVPGEGTRDVYVRREGRALHATRNFDQEQELAQDMLRRCGLEDAEPLERGIGCRLADGVEALAVLAAAEHLDPVPELEWVGRPIRALPAPGPGALRVALERHRNWFGVLGTLSVEGERVELARLLDAARRHERHVEVASHTFIEISEALRRHLERLADHIHAGPHGLQIGPSGVPSLLALDSAGALVEADAAWQDLAARYQAAEHLEPQVPQELTATLRPYQRHGFTWMSKLAAWGAGGVLADDMGLGKTIQALALLLERRIGGPALVLAPTSVAYNWIREAERFAPALRFIDYAEQPDRADALAKLGSGDVLVVRYGMLVRDLALLCTVRFATAIFDEAQNLKNPKAQRTRAARTLHAEVKFALSGTPIENHLGELWSVFSIVFPALLGSWDAFRRRFKLPLEHGLDPRATEALSRIIAPFVLRRTKARVEVELPPRTEIQMPVVLSSEEWQLYEDARLSVLSDLESRREVLREQQRKVEVLSALTRLRRLASHPRLYDARCDVASSKLARFLELADTLHAQGQRALVFSQFTTHLALVREAIEARGISYVYLDGQTPAKQRAQRVQEFQEGDASLFLISLKAGGVGLNLTAATNVVHLDPWWNPAVEDQASDRAHRLGQGRPVTIYRFVAVGTIEEQMLALHGQKRRLVEQVLRGSVENSASSSEALLGLLSTAGDPRA